jgi:hypothetical protein
MRLATFTLGLVVLASALTAQQEQPPQFGPGGPADAQQQAPVDEPGRTVARISVLNGDASVTRGDAGTPVAAAVNAPLMSGDALSLAPGATVEVQVDFANFARIAGDSQARIANLDNGRYQIQLSKGLLTYRVLRQSNAQSEIDTPLVAVHPLGLAAVRVEVAPDSSTRITVRHGEVEVFTPKGSERVREGTMMEVRGAAVDPEFQAVNAFPNDQWDTWNDQRDGYLMRAQSPRYVSPDVVGTEDLDNYGRWSNDPQYGDVWTPNVPTSWAPYRNGQWVWEDYYGWTWVDYAPWGWAPFHYGSWYFRAGFGWCWYPGPRVGHYWYHPARVAFFGFGSGISVGFGFGNVGWVPLAPYEVYRPWYGHGWYGGARPIVVNNISIVHNVNIANEYRNARFANGVTAVTAADFQRGNFGNPVGVQRAQLSQASLVRGAVPVTPSGNNLSFTNHGVNSAIAHSDINSQRFFSRMAPSTAAAQRTPFNQQQSAIHSAFESRGIASGVRPSGLSEPPMRNSGGNTAPGWQRFGGSAPSAGSGGAPRSLNVAPPMVRQRDTGPGYNAPGHNRSGGYFGGQPGYRGAPAPSFRSAPAPQYRAPAPQYRAPAPAPQYRAPSPAPSQRSAPPASRGEGGGHASPGGGDHSHNRR